MKGLLIKDLKYLKMSKNFIFVFLVLSIAYMVIFKSPFFFVAFFTAGGMMISITTFSYDDYDNGSIFLLTLPFTKKQYVREKYLFSICMTTVVWTVSSIIYTIYMLVSDGAFPSSEMLLPLLGIYCAYLCFTGIMIPIEFKFGGEKVGMALMIVFASIFILGFLSNKLLGLFDISLSEIINQISTNPTLVLALAVIVFVAVFLIVSYRICMGIVNRKEY